MINALHFCHYKKNKCRAYKWPVLNYLGLLTATSLAAMTVKGAGITDLSNTVNNKRNKSQHQKQNDSPKSETVADLPAGLSDREPTPTMEARE